MEDTILRFTYHLKMCDATMKFEVKKATCRGDETKRPGASQW